MSRALRGYVLSAPHGDFFLFTKTNSKGACSLILLLGGVRGDVNGSLLLRKGGMTIVAFAGTTASRVVGQLSCDPVFRVSAVRDFI